MRNANFQRIGIPHKNGGILKVSLNDEILDELYNPSEKVRPNVEGLEKLLRLKTTWSTKIDYTLSLKLGSFGYAYQLITTNLIYMGQIEMLHTIRGIYNIIVKSFKKSGNPANYIDDWVRTKLKKLSSWALSYVGSDPAYMFMMHMHQLGGRSPHTDEQIIDDITSWVSKTENRIDANRPFIEKHLNKLMVTWPRSDPHFPHLNFDLFCIDIGRWATSGGAPATSYEGEKYRTKWMWGFKNGGYETLNTLDQTELAKRGHNLYMTAKQAGNVCHVALKEEATKTREVITTPMASYLRQSYLLYRWGKPRHISSPISSASWLQKFNSHQYNWYGAIDGERFDHTVPKWFIMLVIDKLGDLDDECRAVADEELESMEHLKIQWKETTWNWEGGLLSGWRVTSIVGTFLSLIAGEYILQNLNASGMVNVAAMGDDLILYSIRTSLDKNTITELYNAFGLNANPFKTNTGRVGDFLRRLYSPEGVFSYPWLGLKGCIYANPWVDKYTYDLEVEMANNWWTQCSRLIYWSVSSYNYICHFKGMLKEEISHWFPSLQKIDNLLNTPISAGGLGVNQSVESYAWCSLTHPTLSRDTQFLAIFGILKSKLYIKKTAEIRNINYNYLNLAVRKLEHINLKTVTQFKIGDDKCIFPTLWVWYNGPYNCDFISKQLGITIPHNLRCIKPSTLSWIVGQLGSRTSLSSIIVPKENLSKMQSIMSLLLDSLSLSKRNMNTSNFKSAATLYLIELMKDVSLVNGTW